MDFLMIEVEKLQRYLRGELNPSEVSALEDHLSKHDDDRQMLEGLRLLNEDKGDDMALAFLNEAKEDGLAKILASPGGSEQPVTRFMDLKIIRWAAAVLMVATATYLLVNELAPVNNEKLISDYMAADDPDNLKKRTSNIDEAWVSAFIADDYDRTIKLLSEKQNRLNRETLYLGLAKMNVDDYRGAIEVWEEIDDLSLSYGRGRYYSALCYWKLGEQNVAKQLFDKILADKESHGYKEIKRLKF